MPPRVAAWGGYDVPNYGDRLYPAILTRELLHREPALELSLFAPLGTADGQVAPLGAATAERRAALAEGSDLIVIGGGELIHPLHWVLALAYGLPTDALEADRPMLHFAEGLGAERNGRVAWHGVGVPFELEGEFAERTRRALNEGAYVSVRDRESRARLERAGVEADIAVVPDSALLLPRVFPARPAHGSIVVQGASHVVELAADLAQAVEAQRDGRPVVLLSTFPNAGDDDFADAIAPLLRAPVYRAARGTEATVTAIAGSAGFVGTSLHGTITALAYGRPVAPINTDDRSKIEGLAEWFGLEGLVSHDGAELQSRLGRALRHRPDAERLAAAQRALDAHFDQLVEVSLR